MQKIKRAVIPAAGYGTRFLPATKSMPKEMLPIVDKPTIQYIVEEALASGIEDILIISGHAKRAIEDYFDSAPALEQVLERDGKTELLRLVRESADIRVHYIRQRHLNGLGDAIMCARSFMAGEPFAVLLGDDVVHNPERPALRQLMDVYERYGGSVLGCQRVAPEQVSSYGIVAGEPVPEDAELLRVDDMVEKPRLEEAPSNLAVLGRYIITPRVFDILEDVKPGKGGEIQLTDALKVLAKEEAVYAYNFTGRRYDLGNKLGFLQAQVEYALRHDDVKEGFKEYLKSLKLD